MPALSPPRLNLGAGSGGRSKTGSSRRGRRGPGRGVSRLSAGRHRSAASSSIRGPSPGSAIAESGKHRAQPTPQRHHRTRQQAATNPPALSTDRPGSAIAEPRQPRSAITATPATPNATAQQQAPTNPAALSTDQPRSVINRPTPQRHHRNLGNTERNSTNHPLIGPTKWVR